MGSKLVTVNRHVDEKFKTIELTIYEDEPELSYKAKGLHTYLISRPPDWEVQYTDLVNRASDGRDSIKTAVKELKKHGYLKISRERDDQGHIKGSIWHVTANPDELPLDDIEGADEEPEGQESEAEITEKADEVIDYLNELTGSEYQHSKSSREKIRQRLKGSSKYDPEPYTVDQLKAIVDKKVEDWLGDEDMEDYLRPRTLFRPKNCEDYKNEVIRQEKRVEEKRKDLEMDGEGEDWGQAEENSRELDEVVSGG